MPHSGQSQPSTAETVIPRRRRSRAALLALQLQVRELRQSGLNYVQIGRAVGISHSWAHEVDAGPPPGNHGRVAR